MQEDLIKEKGYENCLMNGPICRAPMYLKFMERVSAQPRFEN